MQNSVPSFKVNEVEIIYKRSVSNNPKVSSSNMAADIFRNQFPEGKMDYKEFFYVMLLSQSNEVLGVSQIGVGSTSGVVVNIKEIFQLVLKSNASSLILCHNHPSGSLKSSAADRKLTKKVAECASFLDCKLHDHIILSSAGYFSFADQGEL